MEVPPRVGDNVAMQRNTRQRAAILETLSRQADFRSAQQIHEQMRADGETVGLATVYRNLQALSRAGRLDVLVAGDGESLYRQCEDTGHHHHLVCRECGRTVEFLAHSKGPHGRSRQHERSRFVREDGAWLYVDVDLG